VPSRASGLQEIIAHLLAPGLGEPGELGLSGDRPEQMRDVLTVILHRRGLEPFGLGAINPQFASVAEPASGVHAPLCTRARVPTSHPSASLRVANCG
jgi:hypothetical protein